MADLPEIYTPTTLQDKINPKPKAEVQTDAFVKKAKAVKEIFDVARSILGENVVDKFMQKLGVPSNQPEQPNTRAMIEAQQSVQNPVQPSMPRVEIDAEGIISDLEKEIESKLTNEMTVKELKESLATVKESGLVLPIVRQFIAKHLIIQ